MKIDDILFLNNKSQEIENNSLNLKNLFKLLEKSQI